MKPPLLPDISGVACKELVVHLMQHSGTHLLKSKSAEGAGQWKGLAGLVRDDQRASELLHSQSVTSDQLESCGLVPCLYQHFASEKREREVKKKRNEE